MGLVGVPDNAWHRRLMTYEAGNRRAESAIVFHPADPVASAVDVLRTHPALLTVCSSCVAEIASIGVAMGAVAERQSIAMNLAIEAAVVPDEILSAAFLAVAEWIQPAG